MSGNFAINWGGVGRLMANAILNFHFDFLHPSLSNVGFTNFSFIIAPLILILKLKCGQDFEAIFLARILKIKNYQLSIADVW